MAHATQTNWVQAVKGRFPDSFAGKRVLEIGSYNVNGSVRDLFQDCDYIGVDVAPGLCVDVAWSAGAADWLRHYKGGFDTIVSCECLEHDIHWRDTLACAQTVLAPHGGLMVLTCAAPGRPEHGTLRTSPQDVVPGTPWPTYYHGLDETDLRSALDMNGFLVYEFGKCEFPADTYLWALKR